VAFRWGCVPSEECQRLLNVCLSAFAKNTEAGAAVPVTCDGWHQAQLEATKKTRAAYAEVLDALGKHRAEQRLLAKRNLGATWKTTKPPNVTTSQQLLVEIETARMRHAWAKAEVKRSSPC
jgi:hypothetical protein